MTLKFDMETLGYITALDNAMGNGAQSSVRDCIVTDEYVVFVVENGARRKAVGKNGINSRKLSGALNKKVMIYEYKENVVDFVVQQLLNKLLTKKITLHEDAGERKLIIEADSRTKGAIKGSQNKRIDLIKKLLRRNYDIMGVTVK